MRYIWINIVLHQSMYKVLYCVLKSNVRFTQINWCVAVQYCLWSRLFFYLEHNNIYPTSYEIKTYYYCFYWKPLDIRNNTTNILPSLQKFKIHFHMILSLSLSTFLILSQSFVKSSLNMIRWLSSQVNCPFFTVLSPGIFQ